MENQKTPESVGRRFNEIKQEIAAKAFSDGTFRDNLIADPKATISTEYDLPAGALDRLNINILEEQPGVLTIPIPPAMDDMELTDEQLMQVSGGTDGIFWTVAITLGLAVSATIASDGEGW